MAPPDESSEPDDLDACEVGLADFAVDDETAALLPLFPDHDPAREAEWRELFGGDGDAAGGA